MITYRGRTYTINEVSRIDGTDEGFAFVTNSRGKSNMLFVTLDDDDTVVRAASRNEPWEDVR